jgi:enoyl-CoA hydratase/carnithine racemase
VSEYETVEFEVGHDHVATITLNRPEALNAFNQAMLDELAAIWARCRTDDAIHAIVLQANGDRAFCTGVDQKLGRDRPANPFADEDPGTFLGAKQNRVWKPLVCALHGMVAGGAFYFVNEADVVICSEDATFFDPHVTYGMTSALEPIGLLRRIPLGEVLRFALMGLDERMSAAHAEKIGLVSEVVALDDLRARAHELAKRLADKPTIAIQGTVKAIWQSMEMSAGGARVIPQLYPQVGNPLSRTPMSSTERPKFEIR